MCVGGGCILGFPHFSWGNSGVGGGGGGGGSPTPSHLSPSHSCLPFSLYRDIWMACDVSLLIRCQSGL